jgi:hypothetical protein
MICSEVQGGCRTRVCRCENVFSERCEKLVCRLSYYFRFPKGSVVARFPDFFTVIALHIVSLLVTTAVMSHFWVYVEKDMDSAKAEDQFLCLFGNDSFADQTYDQTYPKHRVFTDTQSESPFSLRIFLFQLDSTSSSFFGSLRCSPIRRTLSKHSTISSPQCQPSRTRSHPSSKPARILDYTILPKTSSLTQTLSLNDAWRSDRCQTKRHGDSVQTQGRTPQTFPKWFFEVGPHT